MGNNFQMHATFYPLTGSYSGVVEKLTFLQIHPTTLDNSYCSFGKLWQLLFYQTKITLSPQKALEVLALFE